MLIKFGLHSALCRRSASKEYCVGFRVPLAATATDRRAFGHLKRKVLEHVQLVGCSGDAHIAALNALQERESQNEKNKKRVVAYVRNALSVVKMKAAGIHMESGIAFLASSGVDVGTIGHSRWAILYFSL